jgi:hypothetical protein
VSCGLLDRLQLTLRDISLKLRAFGNLTSSHWPHPPFPVQTVHFAPDSPADGGGVRALARSFSREGPEKEGLLQVVRSGREGSNPVGLDGCSRNTSVHARSPKECYDSLNVQDFQGCNHNISKQPGQNRIPIIDSRQTANDMISIDTIVMY